MNNKHYLPALLLLAVSLSVHSETQKPWPPGMVDRFLLPLTFPDAEWSDDDFGEQIDPATQALLKKFQPRIYIAPGGLLPIDFYRDYLPNTVIKDDSGNIINQAPDRRYLKNIERNYGYYLDFQGEHITNTAVDLSDYTGAIYGRLYRETMNPPEGDSDAPPKQYLILKYSAVFSASGLPAKLPWYKDLGASIAGDADNWHELDIHGAIHILVNEATLLPEILLLAQHNHFRAYVIGKDIPAWGTDHQIMVCYAQRSNEPYPCPVGSTARAYRTVGNPGNFSYVLTGENALWDGSEDVVFGAQAGAEEISYELKFLPSRDPLYVSWIPLGDKMKILGLFDSFYREGPPGMDMNTFPELKKYTDITNFWYFTEGDTRAAQLFKETINGFDLGDTTPLLKYHSKKLWRALSDRE